jgi:hypothetical protein
MQKRNVFIGYRAQQIMISPNYSDTQSIRSTESPTSQQEILPADIRKRLSEVQTTGPTLFDVRLKKLIFSKS